MEILNGKFYNFADYFQELSNSIRIVYSRPTYTFKICVPF